MRRLLILAMAVVTTLTSSGASAGPDTPVLSGNLTLLGNIPELGAVGGQLRTVNTVLGEKTYFMMSGASGVSAYDVTVPEAPVLAGRLALPNWSNEDVEVGGNLMLVSTDPQWVDWFTPGGTVGGIYILDISKLPAISFAYTNPLTGNRWTGAAAGYAGHTISCISSNCSYAIVNGVEEVVVVDLRTPSAPQVVKRFSSGVGSTHDAQVDATGLVWISGAGGVIGWDMSVPTAPKIAVPAAGGGLRYQHNSLRPRADEWQPGGTGPGAAVGETLLVTEETLFPLNSGTPMCAEGGRFQTRRVRDADAIGSGASTSVTVMDTWEPTDTLARTQASCSAHYFSERDGIVAIAWYQAGIRLLDVSDPADIKQVGYYINPATWVFGAEWIGEGAAGGEIFYTLDPARGVDILRFDRTPILTEVHAPSVTPDASVPAFLPKRGAVPHPTFGYACSLI